MPYCYPNSDQAGFRWRPPVAARLEKALVNYRHWGQQGFWSCVQQRHDGESGGEEKRSTGTGVASGQDYYLGHLSQGSLRGLMQELQVKQCQTVHLKMASVLKLGQSCVSGAASPDESQLQPF
jgi:hypothetical protein